MEKRSEYPPQEPYNHQYPAYNVPPQAPANQFAPQAPANQFPPQPPANQYPPNYTEAQRYSPQIFPPAQVVITTTTGVAPPLPPSQPQTSYNPSYPPQNAPPATGCFARNQKNKPQSNSIGAASFVFISGGMSWAWSCQLASPTQFPVSLHMLICWFIAAIIGAIISAALVRRIHTKLIHVSASILVTIGGILFLAMPSNAAAITAARYLDGIGVGLVLVPTLILAGEESVKDRRGMNAATAVAMNFSCGIFIGIIYASIYTSYMDYNLSFTGTQLHGLLCTFYGALSAMMSFFLVVESPVYYLVRHEEGQAIDSLRRLQRPFTVTFETYEMLEELKRYVAENNADGGNGLLALFKLSLYKVLATLSFSLATSAALVTSSLIYLSGYAAWTLILFGILRWVGTSIASLTMDSWGRKKPMIIGATVCGGMAIGIGAILNDDWNFLNTSSMATVVYLLFVMQFFSGFFSSASPVYDSEAYPLAYKQYFIASGFIVEMLVQIIITSCTIELGAYFIAMGVLYFMFFFFALFALPETKHDSLRVAQGKFRGFSSRQMEW